MASVLKDRGVIARSEIKFPRPGGVIPAHSAMFLHAHVRELGIKPNVRNKAVKAFTLIIDQENQIPQYTHIQHVNRNTHSLLQTNYKLRALNSRMY